MGTGEAALECGDPVRRSHIVGDTITRIRAGHCENEFSRFICGALAHKWPCWCRSDIKNKDNDK